MVELKNMNKINKLAILSLFFSVLPFILYLLLAIFDPFNFLDDIIYPLFIYSLLIAPAIALILGIIVLIKRKNSSELFIFLALIAIIISYGLYSYILLDISKPHPKARDPRRQSDMHQISLAMEMYYDQFNKYLQSETLPNSIGNYLNPMPTDPGSGPCSSYQWISNMSNPQKYCIWACSEYEVGKFFVVSPKGVKTLDKAPTDLNCGEEVKKELETTTNKTADWQTYTNKEYGFEIKYPKDYYANIEEKKGVWGVSVLMRIAIDQEKISDYITPLISIHAVDKNFILGTRDWKDFKIGGINGSISYTWKGSKLELCEIVFKSKTNQNFYITTKYNPLEDKITNQILSTFKFIEQKPSITIISPNGGETWQIGNIHNITWQDNVTTSDNIVKIVLETPTGNNILGIIAQTIDTGFYQWNTTLNLGMGQKLSPGNYKIDMCKGDVCDGSDNYFTISN